VIRSPQEIIAVFRQYNLWWSGRRVPDLTEFGAAHLATSSFFEYQRVKKLPEPICRNSVRWRGCSTGLPRSSRELETPRAPWYRSFTIIYLELVQGARKMH